ncbi:MAG: class I SAM-dependent methyltransferase, partial [Vicinamibacteria bacterium]
MSERVLELRRAWEDRERRLGSTEQAVLFKRFPRWLNHRIHRRHVDFILRNLPPHTRRLLDVGCGYGRISREVKRRFPAIAFQGIDLCPGFAAAYSREIGPCFAGPVQDFRSDGSYDAILIVTLLMYLDAAEHAPMLRRLWSLLAPGGRLLCIEPAIEMVRWWRRIMGRASASPTGGSIHHFSRPELEELLGGLEGGTLREATAIELVPLIPGTALHYA